MIDRDIELRPTVGQAIGRALSATFTTCGPPDLPADTARKRLADRLLPRGGRSACGYFLAVAGLWSLYSALSGWAGLAVAAVASFAGGAWCSANFWRCRHAHCLVTGAGWSALAGLSASEALLGHSVIGGFEGIAFLAVLAAGVAFEAGWYFARGTHAVRPHAPGRPPYG